MPELPEVETTRMGLEPHIVGKRISHIEVLENRLRWPVSHEIESLKGKKLLSLSRRAKYLLFEFTNGYIIGHLGMSGSMRVIDSSTPLKKHDHVLINFGHQLQLRYHDPRRFGCLLWTKNPHSHPLLNKLGPEPLSDNFNTNYLHTVCRNKNTTIKQHIMNAKIVVGVGNIYASEALHMARISPKKKASEVSKMRIQKLTESIKIVLQRSIDQGGTTLRDFLDPDGTAGYFKQQLLVYDREGETCKSCPGSIKKIILGQRATYYCPGCQR